MSSPVSMWSPIAGMLVSSNVAFLRPDNSALARCCREYVRRPSAIGFDAGPKNQNDPGNIFAEALQPNRRGQTRLDVFTPPGRGRGEARRNRDAPRVHPVFRASHGEQVLHALRSFQIVVSARRRRKETIVGLSCEIPVSVSISEIQRSPPRLVAHEFIPRAYSKCNR